jgi:Arc/MetJ-type ribon-helix-helix transcriptional regulator
MSQGNPIIKLRIPREMLAEINARIAERNLVTRNEPWDLSAFLRASIREMLRKIQAGRKPRTKKTPTARVKTAPASAGVNQEEN